MAEEGIGGHSLVPGLPSFPWGTPALSPSPLLAPFLGLLLLSPCRLPGPLSPFSTLHPSLSFLSPGSCLPSSHVHAPGPPRRHPYLSCFLFPFHSLTPASPASSLLPCSEEHPFSPPRAGERAGRAGGGGVESGRGIKSRSQGCPLRPGLAMRWSRLRRSHMPAFWMKHGTKSWGTVGEDGWGGAVRADVGCGRGDSLGLSARQSFQPWSCWTFPRDCPPWARPTVHLDRPWPLEFPVEVYPGSASSPEGPRRPHKVPGSALCPPPPPSLASPAG